ncbi:two-component system NtrC family sensor kinase [Azospirillum agricola]|uniref:hybrid sensor histidine kinase/response regulator n=1 Tax=Azospirillum agricola TaxID=1720247 RepID=UPI001AE4A654|nr:hybrid sensor histidine kinase/response regulator [Azospirillum agricola]MBP2228028.1 two-component system NtrC family sensor kinase [Azospirillum agricola]
MPFPMLDSLAGRTGSLRLLRLLLAVSVSLPLVLFAGIGWREERETWAEAERNSRKTALILHEHVLKVFDTIEQVLDRVNERIDGMAWTEIAGSQPLHRYLKILDDDLEQVGVIAVTDPDGVIRAASNRFPTRNAYIGGRAYFRTQKERDAGLLVGESMISQATGRRSFGLSRRRGALGATDGAFDGLVHATVNPDYFTHFYHRVLADRGETVSLVRADGQVLLRYPAYDDNRTVILPPNRGLLKAVLSQPDEGSFAGISYSKGIERFYAYKKVGDFPVYVVYAIDSAMVGAIWWRNMALDAAFAAPATLALALLAWLAYSRARSESQAVRRWAEEVRNRQRLEETLRQSQKMEALGQLTGGVAHDFNNLLTAALANLHLLARHLPDEARRFLNGANTALERAEKLTRQLLSFSRQEAVNPAVVDFADSLRQMGDLLERSIRADIALDWDLTPTPLPIAVDPVQLELAVLNLVLNARDAMPQGGRVRLSLRPGPAPLTARLEIADTGAGMTPEVQARAFDPFFTTKETGKGTGLGLSMVYGFARQSGGSVAIDSRPGEGTRVRIDLPLSPPPAPPPPLPAETADRPDRPPRVLVVEDNALVLLATVEGLAQEGFTVETADHGVAALEILETDQAFDIVVSDVVMPHGVSGIDLARRIRERWPHLRVLLASGYSPESLATMGADTAAVLAKPFTPDQLAARIRAILATPAPPGAGAAPVTTER